MSKSLHAAFNVVSGSVYFNIVIFNIHGRKMRFSESTQNPMSKNRFLVTLRSFFSTYKFFPGHGGDIFLLIHSSRSILTKG